MHCPPKPIRLDKAIADDAECREPTPFARHQKPFVGRNGLIDGVLQPNGRQEPHSASEWIYIYDMDPIGIHVIRVASYVGNHAAISPAGIARHQSVWSSQ